MKQPDAVTHQIGSRRRGAATRSVTGEKPKVSRRQFLTHVGAGAATFAAANIIRRTSADAQDANTVVIAQSADLHSLDPHITSSAHSQNVYPCMYDRLIDRGPDLRLRESLAESWRATGPTTWEFKLRHGVTFHNGEPFNAAAVKFSFEQAFSPAKKWDFDAIFHLISSVDVVDDYTVRISTKTTWPYLLQYLGYYGPWMIPPQYIKANGDDVLARSPVSTGPYKFVRWLRDDRLELEAYDNYWRGQPKIKRVIVRAIPNDSVRLEELQAGSVDLINIVPPPLFAPIQHSKRAKFVSAPSTGIYFIALNLVNVPPNRPLGDKRVRQALNYAIDVKGITRNLLSNVGTPVATFCTNLAFACDMSINPYPRDLTRARALLSEAGYPNGFDLTFISTVDAYPADRDISLAVAAQLNEVGVRARVVFLELGVALDTIRSRKMTYDGAFLRSTDWIGYAGSIALRAFTPAGAFALWVPDDPVFEQMLQTGETTLDQAKATDAYRRAQLIYKDQCPAINLMTAPNAYGMGRKLVWTPRADLALTMVDASWQA